MESRGAGTLLSYRSEIDRTNVNGEVKQNRGYEAHRDFAVLVARLVCFATAPVRARGAYVVTSFALLLPLPGASRGSDLYNRGMYLCA